MWVLREPDFWEYYPAEYKYGAPYSCAFSLSSGRAYVSRMAEGVVSLWHSVEAMDIPDTVTTEDEAKAWLLAVWRMR